jgi:radical SAM protein (TIGR04043 family)
MTTTAQLKARLQCLGVRLPDDDRGRRGGAGPAAGKSLIFGNTVANVPTQSRFVSESPYHIEREGDDYAIWEDERRLVHVTSPHTPAFYAKTTSDGTPMRQVALLHGASCLASTVCQTCVYYDTPQACTFCGIELSLRLGDTIAEKTPHQLAEVARAAVDEHAVNHVTLTSGTQRGPDKGLGKLKAAARAIKDETGLPVQVQVEPLHDLSQFDDMREWGVDSIGIHIESLDDEVLKRHAPVKARYGFSAFLKAWRRAREVLGDNQVESFILAGLGEDIEVTTARFKEMVEAGAYPFVVALRPIPGTRLETWRPPPPDHLIELSRRAAQAARDGALTWKRYSSGCLRCRACSCVPDFERE